MRSRSSPSYENLSVLFHDRGQTWQQNGRDENAVDGSDFVPALGPAPYRGGGIGFADPVHSWKSRAELHSRSGCARQVEAGQTPHLPLCKDSVVPGWRRRARRNFPVLLERRSLDAVLSSTSSRPHRMIVSVPPSRDGRGRAEVMNGRSAPRAVICAHRTRGSVGRCHGLTERLRMMAG